MKDEQAAFLKRLNTYRDGFERLATKAESGADWNQSRECLTHAWKLTDHILTCESLFNSAGLVIEEEDEPDTEEKPS